MSSAEKMLEFQQQVRHNNEDLQDYLRDLNNWETAIKQKDDKLRHETSSANEKTVTFFFK